ncbi:MAG: NAD(P)-dependent glycerol-3-phosphate dehydrogenase [Gammaproteobacteria bacterium]|nr:NAD(P)-dependent glycerol-3-phosphate dehydrogenase [Gammaproteobacteria bacterium]
MAAGYTTFAVLGAGSWGTALAAALVRNEHQVTLWGRDAGAMQALAANHENTRYLPGIRLPEALRCTARIEDALTNRDAVIVAVPTSAFRTILKTLRARAPGVPLVWACKGLEAGSGKFMHVLVEEELGADASGALISGPTFAAEVARGLPAATSVAAPDLAFATRVAAWFHSESLRAYPNDDLIGVELGGAVKNVLAIAAGIADGLGFGVNSRAALITRGLAEIMRLGEALGARRETLMGLSGLGDLVLTCTDDQSRNRRYGLLLAAGLDGDAALAKIAQAVEGVKTAREICALAANNNVEMPISEQVYKVIYEQHSPRAAVQALLRRELTSE